MCAFLSRPHQATPHLFERMKRCRPPDFLFHGRSSATAVRAGRPWSYTFCSPRRFSRQLPSKAFLTGFSCLSQRELSHPSLSNFIARSLENWEFDFLQPESLVTFSASKLPLQSIELSNLSDLFKNVTPIEILSFTFVSTVLGIMVAYIVHELKDDGGISSLRLVGDDRQGSPPAKNSSSTLRDNGETEATHFWLNLSRSSPFFRAVCARCPSLSSSSPYQYTQKLRFKKPEYQRRCLPTSDGGTVALDWPSHLDIGDCQQLENTMLLVCGTTEGSHEDGIVKLSQLLEQHGYFPIVFNPRGCGGSPLTTPRVFSAADSDDVRLGVNFIAKSRPGATIFSIGWGLGANILARYLGEEGSYTPLGAAVCIDNPFDLSSVARPISGSRWHEFNCALSEGLTQILASNKLLFQGEKKGFDVSGALAATSVQDFDRAISRVAHGFKTLEDFYLNASSGATLDRVQIPLLCIQHLDDYERTQASIPQNVFERNVYTMLLLSRLSNSRDDHPGAASEWTHAISLEWLAAVEISLLKGRHPLLSEFSPTITLQRNQGTGNQLNGAYSEEMGKGAAVAVPDSTSGNSYHEENTFEEADLQRESTLDATISHAQAREVKDSSVGRSAASSKAYDGDSAKAVEPTAGFDEGQQAGEGDGAKAMEPTADFDEGQQAGEGLTEAEEAERGQAVQLSETVMNIMDVTMPGTLADAQKQQVLKAVGRGETLVTALEEAVPEDVRGKISTAVSEVVQAQGRGFKIPGMETPAPVLPVGITHGLEGTLARLTGKKEAPKSGLDVSSGSRNESSDDKGMNSSTAQSDDPSKQITLGESDKSSKLEKLSSNDESKGTAAIISEEKDPSKNGQASSNDPKDITQQSQNKSGGEDKKVGDVASTGSPNREGQTNDRGDQEKKDQEQPRGSADSAIENKKGTLSGVGSEVTNHTDSSSDKLDGGDPGVGQISSTEEKDNAKDVKDQVDSGQVGGGKVTVEGGKVPKDGEIKRDVTSPSDNALGSPQSDAPSPTTSVATEMSLQTSNNTSSTEAPTDKSKPDNGSQPSDPRNTVVPSETSTSPPLGSEASQSDQQIAKESADSASTPPSSQASQSDNRDIETPAAPPSPPPQDSPPAPANPPPESPPATLPSVGEAFQALTGFDDSTQMAVTNVFGVVETVLDQLEKDSPSTEDNTSGKLAVENLLNQATKKSETSASDSKTNADEDGNDPNSDDNQSKNGKLGPDNLHRGKHLQSLDERKEEMNQPNAANSLVEVERADPENGSSRFPASGLGVKPSLRKNERGYIKGAFETSSREVQDFQDYPQSTVSERDSNSVRESPSQEVDNDGFLAESANEKRLRILAAQVDAEGEETAKSAGSDQVAADNRESGERMNQSSMVADLVMNALKLEVVRRLGAAGLEALGVDLEKEVTKVAHAVSEVVTMGKDNLLGEGSRVLKGDQDIGSNLGGKLGVLNGNSITAALGSVLGSNSLLVRLLPFGVLAGVVMAALGATYLLVSDDQEEELAETERSTSLKEHDINPSSAQRASSNPATYRGKSDDEVSEELGDGLGQDATQYAKHGIPMEEDDEWNETDEGGDPNSTGFRDEEEKSTEQTPESNPPHQGKLMGAMAAAMGASAAVASTTSTSVRQSGDSSGSEGGEQRNLVPQLAEKALSVVSPVVPKTEAGELDHERLVAVLAEVGQKGGPLTLIGKAALLWGGLRGAMSLADRLLAFFRIGERPLWQRLLGFGGMALLLWTPVLVPLLPTLLQQWATKAPNGVADAAAGIGLYGAVFILVTIWGRRVRGYDRPLVSYGLQLFSRGKLRLFAGGLATGLGLVSGYYAVNWLLGYSQFAWDATVVTSPDFPGPVVSTVLTSWKLLLLVTQSLTMSTAVALVEELLFRAWLQEEIAVDAGYHWAVFLSALAFAVVHWSPTAMVGLWFCAVALSGARARKDGDLSLPIGIHAGVVTAFSVMNAIGLVRYIPETPTWITGAYAGNPLAGALGTGMVVALTIVLYPRQKQRLPDEE